MYYRLWEWVDLYNATDHPALGLSPNEAYTASLASSGLRTNKLIPYDDQFKQMTMFTTAKSTAKVQPGSGVRVNYIDYWSNLMRDPEIEGTSVEVRYDPNDVSYVLANINGRWVQCVSVHTAILKGKSEKYIQFAAQEMREQRSDHNHNYPNRLSNFARFLASTDSEARELIAIKNAEEKGIRAAINQDVTPLNEPDIYGVEPESIYHSTDTFFTNENVDNQSSKTESYDDLTELEDL